MKRITKRYAEEVLAAELKQAPQILDVNGIPAGSFGFFISSIYLALKNKRPMVVLSTSNQEAEALSQEVSFYLGNQWVEFFPGYESIPYEFSGLSQDISGRRIRTIFRLLQKEPVVLCTSPEAIIRKMPGPERFTGLALELNVNQEIQPDQLASRLMSLGYNRVDRVELPGDYTKKGSILDLYPLNFDVPIRVDFFDDWIDSIRTFEAGSQMAMDRVSQVTILPAGEIILTENETKEFYKKINKENKELERPVWSHGDHGATEGDGFNLTQILHPGIEELYPLVFQSVHLDAYYKGQKPLVIQIRPDRLETRIQQIQREFHAMYEKESQNKVTIAPGQLISEQNLEELLGQSGSSPWSQQIRISETGFDQTGHDTDSVQVSPEKRWKLAWNPSFKGRIRDVRSKILEIKDGGGKILITSPYRAQMQRISGIFRGEDARGVTLVDSEEANVPPEFPGQKDAGEILIYPGNHREGFSIPEFGFYLWSDTDIFGRSYRRKSSFKRTGSTPVDSFLDLKEKDFVVHVNYGVGRFLGLERVKAAGKERDFLVLEYADQDRLFVPLDQISLVQKYSSHVENPKLDSLGKASFKKVKERVEKRVEEFAHELIKIYAVRMARKGYAFPDDTSWQDEFESEFPYEETPDQLAAIESVKRDMETDRPMDRLVCGDVGYGKTEIAIRATFKSVMSGKQVALIAPTTILAMQHFRNFSERFKEFPIKVDWVSRFRTQKEITAVKKALRQGEIDVVIGTHALISKDYYIKNLGLLIVDEEQRFGVGHKEAIKNYRKLVDVLTMSATPIPRTLHMSLVGIRDISIIQTPPRDRLPVRTYAMEDSDSILQEAITRELERGGQIFFLHNRVETIAAAAERIRTLMPDISLAVLHGKMEDDEIEDILMDFLEKKYDLLVTTTIIESGIDMPNVNTLIVDRADTFGLSQLYQIRGRVGRSDRQAYAYLFYPDGRALSEQAQKRLGTILEYQDLGSGFKVAMRDLEIRGAGNVLGKEQSGDIMDVGYELYVKLLDDAVKRLQGDEVEVEVRTAINLGTDFLLPEDYIGDLRQRVEFYKRFEAARSIEEVETLSMEMQDRFGKPPEAAITFVDLEKIRTLASRAGFETVFHDNRGRICLKAGEQFRIPPAHLIEILKTESELSVEPGNQNTLFLNQKKGTIDRTHVIELLKKLVEPVVDRSQHPAEPTGPSVHRI